MRVALVVFQNGSPFRCIHFHFICWIVSYHVISISLFLASKKRLASHSSRPWNRPRLKSIFEHKPNSSALHNIKIKQQLAYIKAAYLTDGRNEEQQAAQTTRIFREIQMPRNKLNSCRKQFFFSDAIQCQFTYCTLHQRRSRYVGWSSSRAISIC